MPEAEHHLLWAGNESPDPRIAYASLHQMPQSPRKAAAAIRRVREAVQAVKPDVVHAHSSFAGVYTRLARLDVPVFYEPHCYKFDDGEQHRAMRASFRMAEKILARRSACTVVLSPHEEALAKSLDRQARTHFLPNVATVSPSEAHPSVSFDSGRNVFMVGRLTGQKDPDYFAAVARRVKAVAPDVTFRWVGDVHGQDDGVGEGMRKRLIDAGVEVLGWLVGDALARELSRPGLYFHSAHYEGFPLSLLDAAAFEHPLAVRSIPTFDGLDIPAARSADDAADLILDILDGGQARPRAVEAARHLNRTMNHDAQRDALRALYATV
ncbi:glycosyltransferase [Microbacterium sp. JZ70]